jgi:hypothetical protein
MCFKGRRVEGTYLCLVIRSCSRRSALVLQDHIPVNDLLVRGAERVKTARFWREHASIPPAQARQVKRGSSRSNRLGRGYSTSLTESFSNGSSSPSALMVPRPTETRLRVCLDELVFCSSHTWPHLTKAAATTHQCRLPPVTVCAAKALAI